MSASMRRSRSSRRGTRPVPGEGADAVAPRGVLRVVGRVLAAALAAAFVALLVYGLLSKATNDTIDEGLKRKGSAAAPAIDLPVLHRGSLGPALQARVGPALGTRRISLAQLRGTPVVLNFW